MNEEHRNVFRTNRTTLINNITDIEIVLDMLIEKDIITDNMNQEIMSKKTPIDKARALVDTIPKRGKTAFKIFCDILLKTKQRDLALTLDPSLASSIGAVSEPSLNNKSSGKAEDEKAGKSASGGGTTPVPPSAPMESMSPTKSSPHPQPMSVSMGEPRSGDKSPKVKDENMSSKPSLPAASNITPSSKSPGASGSSIPASDQKQTDPGKSTATNLGREQSRELKKTYQPTVDINDITLHEASAQWPNSIDIKISSNEFHVKEGTTDDMKLLLKSSEQQLYDVSGARRCMIINNWMFKNEALEERSNSQMDSCRIQQVLKDLGFKTRLVSNVSCKQDLMDVIKKETVKLDSSVGVFVVIILSYGGNGTVMCTDGEMVLPQEIVDLFSAQNCPALQGKPKLLLIQACGAKYKDMEDVDGVETDNGMENIRKSLETLQLGASSLNSSSVASSHQSPSMASKASQLNHSVTGPPQVLVGPSGDRADTKGRPYQVAPSMSQLPDPLNIDENSDILVAMATTPDERDSNYRSLFILTLSYMLCRCANTDHFRQILTKVNQLKLSDSGAVELCQYKDSFNKLLYLPLKLDNTKAT